MRRNKENANLLFFVLFNIIQDVHYVQDGASRGSAHIILHARVEKVREQLVATSSIYSEG